VASGGRLSAYTKYVAIQVHQRQAESMDGPRRTCTSMVADQPNFCGALAPRAAQHQRLGAHLLAHCHRLASRAASFDHKVGAGADRRRHFQPEHFGRAKIDEKLPGSRAIPRHPQTPVARATLGGLQSAQSNAAQVDYVVVDGAVAFRRGTTPHRQWCGTQCATPTPVRTDRRRLDALKM
jgi:hypothetical protein